MKIFLICSFCLTAFSIHAQKMNFKDTWETAVQHIFINTSSISGPIIKIKDSTCVKTQEVAFSEDKSIIKVLNLSEVGSTSLFVFSFIHLKDIRSVLCHTKGEIGYVQLWVRKPGQVINFRYKRNNPFELINLGDIEHNDFVNIGIRDPEMLDYIHQEFQCLADLSNKVEKNLETSTGF